MPKKFLITDADLNHTLKNELSDDDYQNAEDGDITIICLEDMTVLNQDGENWEEIPSED